jgi:UDP-N-acetylglucosamine:LPS N-acetylglucosamine transferase
VTDFFNYRTKQIHIAYQFGVPHISIFAVFVLIILFSRSKIVTIQMPSLLTNKVIPPLIDLKKINREKIIKKLIIAYSVSGNNFPNILATLAKNFTDYKFVYFTKTKIKNNLPNNIELNIPSKIKFKNYLKYCGAVLCTSGNELITECVYNKIPVATIYTSEENFEQKHNFKKYVKKLNYALPMTENLDINLLVNRNTENAYKNLSNILKNRDEKILNLCEI